MLAQHEFNMVQPARNISTTLQSYLYLPVTVSVPPEQIQVKQSEFPIEYIEDTEVKKDNQTINNQTINDAVTTVKQVESTTVKSTAVPHLDTTFADTSAPVETDMASANQVNTAEHAAVSINALTNLQTQIADSVLAQSSAESYQQYLASKNTITQSTASLQEKPSIKLTEVDCASKVNTGVAMVSMLFGGTIICNKPSAIAPYINERLINNGVKKP